MKFVVVTFINCETTRKEFYCYAEADHYFNKVKKTKHFEILTLMNNFGHIYEEVLIAWLISPLGPLTLTTLSL